MVSLQPRTPFRNCLERSRGDTLIKWLLWRRIEGGTRSHLEYPNWQCSCSQPYEINDARGTLLLLSARWHTFAPECRRLSSGEIDQPQLQTLDYGPGPIGDPQLRDDVLDVVLGRTEANYEVPSDLTVGASQLH